MVSPIPQQTIHHQQLDPVVAPFNEGAASTMQKVIAFVCALIASVVSFAVLPFEGALFAALGSGTLASLFACQGDRDSGSENSGFFTRLLSYLPFGSSRSTAVQPARVVQPVRPAVQPAPVAQPGARVLPGAGDRQAAPAPLAVRRHPNAVRLPAGVQPQLRPVAHRQQPAPRQAAERRAPVAQPGARVLPGAGHRQAAPAPGLALQPHPNALPVRNPQPVPQHGRAGVRGGAAVQGRRPYAPNLRGGAPAPQGRAQALAQQENEPLRGQARVHPGMGHGQ